MLALKLCCAVFIELKIFCHQSARIRKRKISNVWFGKLLFGHSLMVDAISYVSGVPKIVYGNALTI